MTNVSLAFPLADDDMSAALARELHAVEQSLAGATAHADPIVNEAANHLASAGGKRLRPVLTLLTAHLGAGINDDVRKAAVVVELTHLASLYHDDVMDSAPMRRGAPSAHEVWGNSVAILTGDLLFARASRLVADLGPEAVRIQAATFERLCLGQLHETLGPLDGVDPVTHYIDVLADKTASLLATSALLGARYAQASQEVQDTVAHYGELVGVAFQLADDVIDVMSDGNVTGKTPGTDLREQVPTMPVLLLRKLVASDRATASDRELLAMIDSDLSSDEALSATVARLREHQVIEDTRQRATHYASQAVAVLAALPQGTVRKALEDFAQALVDRTA
ncbi:polyprenyl synthetase family protein [Jonesia quinghaiensis]|uniref:polyprenyl synthetase family protein n=1 Tax=Jonesia quinghaiensis TaxID=262806 RepID=UPI00048EA0B7|nr:polyprenyl synthetase family protein [Jonesia quinghaiensis]